MARLSGLAGRQDTAAGQQDAGGEVGSAAEARYVAGKQPCCQRDGEHHEQGVEKEREQADEQGEGIAGAARASVHGRVLLYNFLNLLSEFFTCSRLNVLRA